MKRLSLSLLLALGTHAVMATAPSDGLVAFYTFDGNALDVTGRGHNGTVQGATLTTDRFGNPNSAYAFNGSSIIDVPTSTDFDYQPATGMTYSLWALLPQYVYPEHLLGRRDSVHSFFWQLAIGDGAMANSDVPLNQWVNIALTFGATSQNYYVNGVPARTTTYPLPDAVTDNMDVFIGGSGPYTPFTGSLDNVRIYNHILTDTEIQQIYQAEVPEPGTQTLLMAGLGGFLASRTRRQISHRLPAI